MEIKNVRLCRVCAERTCTEAAHFYITFVFKSVSFTIYKQALCIDFSEVVFRVDLRAGSHQNFCVQIAF